MFFLQQTNFSSASTFGGSGKNDISTIEMCTVEMCTLHSMCRTREYLFNNPFGCLCCLLAFLFP